MSDPILVPPTPTPAQMAAGIRQVATVLGTVLSTLGFSDAAVFLTKIGVDPQMAGTVGAVAAVISIVWGQIATRRNAKKLVVTANAAPNTVARLK